MNESHDIGLSAAILLLWIVLMINGGHLAKAIHNGWNAADSSTTEPIERAP